MSQIETIKARNSLIWWTLFYTVATVVVVVGGVAYKLGGDFGYKVNEPVDPAFYRQMVEVRIKPVGQVNIAVAVAPVAAAPTAPAPKPTSDSSAKPAETAVEPAKPTEVAKPSEPVKEEHAGDKKEYSDDNKEYATLTTEQATALITDKGYLCLSCHQVDAKLVGPGYKEVAAKYKGDANAAKMLVKKVTEGGAGTWGEMPMPANAVSDDDVKALVNWILSLQ